MKTRVLLCLICLLACFGAHALCETTAYVQPPVSGQQIILRKDADKQSPALGRIYTGVAVTVLEEKDGFSRVRVGTDAVTGYMLSTFVKETPAQPATPYAQVCVQGKVSGAALYPRADSSAKPLEVITHGTLLRVLGEIGNQWLLVCDPADASLRCGLMQKSHLLVFPYANAEIPKSAQSATILQPQGKTINLRATPQTSARTLASFYSGTAVTTCYRKGDWTFVRVGDASSLDAFTFYGYVQTRFVRTKSSTPTAPDGIVRKNTVLTLKAAEGSDTLGTLPKGARVHVNARSGDYALIATANPLQSVGYVPLSALELVKAPSVQSAPSFAALASIALPEGETEAAALFLCDDAVPLYVDGVAKTYPNGTSMLVLSNLGDYTQVYDGQYTPLVKTSQLRLLSDAVPFATQARFEAGTYLVGGYFIKSGLYTYTVPAGKQGSLKIEGEDYERTYAPKGPASYTVYLPSGTHVRVGKGGTLSTLDTTLRSAKAAGSKATCGRFLVGVNLDASAFWVSPQAGAAQSYVVITTPAEETAAQPQPRLRISIPEGSASARTRLQIPAGSFVEFVGITLENTSTFE